jgi:exopolysaccharide biosynthesis polyprenyl glycosylphosphotransferase
MKKWLKQHYDFLMFGLQVMFDYLVITGILFFSYWLWLHSDGIRHNLNPRFLSIELFLALGLLFVAILKMTGAYQRELSIGNVKELRAILRGCFLAYGILIIVSFFFPKVNLSRLQSVYALSILPIGLGLERIFVHQLHRFFIKKEIGTKRILVYGAGETGNRLVKHLGQVPKLGYKVVGFVDDNKFQDDSTTSGGSIGPEILGRLENVKDLASKYEVDEMFITMPSAPSERISHIIDSCNGSLPKYRFVPSMSSVKLQEIEMNSLNGIPLCSFKERKERLFGNIVKRAFDFLFSAVLLIATAPVLAVIAMRVKLDSKGPVLFKQQRVGKNGKLFTMYKFRTMYTEANPYAYTPTTKYDPRITRIGRLLRKTSLDELPQFLNVLKGDMSVVGPRPEMKFIVDSYNELQRQRLSVKPGITGLWQISPDRHRPIHEGLEHDLQYIENQSFLLDLIVIWETLIFGVRGI